MTSSPPAADAPQPQAHQRLSRRKRAVFGCFTLLLLLTGIPLVFEAALRALSPRTSSPLLRIDPLQEHIAEGRLAYFRSQYHWELAPGATATSKYGAVYRINSRGFNWREFDRRPAAGLARIITMGDSSAFGWEVQRSESLAAALEREFAARYPKTAVEVINCGVPGHTIKQGLVLLQQRVLRFQPDVITVTYGWNDWTQHAGWLTSQHDLIINHFGRYLLSSWLLENCRLMQGIGVLVAKRRLINKLENTGRLRLPEELPRGNELRVAYFRDTLERFVDVCRKRRVDVLFAPVSAPPPIYREFQAVAREKGVLMVDLEPLLLAEHGRISRETGNLAGPPPPASGKFISGANFERIRGDNVLFLDNSHPNPQGYQFIAGQTAPLLRQILAGRLARSVD